MTSSEEYDDPTPNGLEQIRFVVGNLWEDFGSTSSALFGLAINVALGSLGVLVYALADGVLAFAGIVWALIHVFAIVSWVMSR